MTQRQADINRMILTVLSEMNPCTVDDIGGYWGWDSLKPSRAELVQGCKDMRSYGYAEHRIPGDSEYLTLTEKGRRQLQKDGVALDPAVWGRAAAL